MIQPCLKPKVRMIVCCQSGDKLGDGGLFTVHPVPSACLPGSHRFGSAHQGDASVPMAGGSATLRTRCPLATFMPLLWATRRDRLSLLSITITAQGYPSRALYPQNPQRHTLGHLGPPRSRGSYPSPVYGLAWPKWEPNVLGGPARRRAQESGATLPGQDLGQLGLRESQHGVSGQGVPIPSGPQPDTPDYWRVQR